MQENNRDYKAKVEELRDEYKVYDRLAAEALLNDNGGDLDWYNYCMEGVVSDLARLGETV